MSNTTPRAARGWRVAARLARREVRRRPGRSALVAGLVAVPVAVMLFAAGTQRANELTSDEQWTFELGRADGVAFMEVPPSGLPAGSRAVGFASGHDEVATGEGTVCACEVSDAPLADPLTEGMARITSGRAPTADGEVLVSPTVARLLEVDLGDRVELTHPIQGRVTVVGIGWLRQGPSDAATVVLAPGALVDGPRLPMIGAKYLVELPEGASRDEVAQLFSRPRYTLSPAPWIDVPAPGRTIDNQDMEVRWTLVGGAVGLTVLGIVIAAAFAVGARRQLVTLGQLAANGAQPATLRRVLFLQGTVTGLVGTAVGLGLGGVALHLSRPWLVTLVNHDLAGWHLRWNDVAAIAGLGVVAATLAALVPAFSASRVPVLTALAGRRPLGRVPRWLLRAGLVACIGGLGLMAIAVAHPGDNGAVAGGNASLVIATVGAVALLVGVCALAPKYVTVLDRSAVVLRGPWRLAARSLSRQRSRTSAVVAALGVTSAVAIAAAALLVGTRRETDLDRLEQPPADVVRLVTQSYSQSSGLPLAGRRPSADAERRIARALPDAVRHQVSEVIVPGQPTAYFDDSGAHRSGGVVVADRAVAEAYGLSAQTRELLDDAGVVVVGERTGPTRLQAWLPSRPEPLWRSDGLVVGPDRALDLRGAGTLFVTPVRARSLGLEIVPTDVVFRTPQPLTDRQLNRLEGLYGAMLNEQTEIDGVSSATYPDFYRPGNDPEPRSMEAAAAAAALLLALFVVAATLGLSAVESRDERDVLAVVGAAPATLRRAGARKAVLLTLLGGAMAVPVGYLPVLLLTRMDDGGGLPAIFPWRTVAVVTVGVPVIAGLATSLVSGIGQRLRPVTMSTLRAE